MEKIITPIFMIGMPGTGKTAISKKLSKALHIPYIDLDAEIEKEAHLFISEIFDTYGEDTFRALETKMLKRYMHFEGIISCGGGIVLNPKHKKLMQDGIIVHVMTDIKIIEKRLEHSHTRPLLKKVSLKQLHDTRMDKYLDFADVTILNNSHMEKSVQDILEFLRSQQ